MWPFTRKPKEPPAPKEPRDQRGWVEDWKVGDIAICINDGWVPPSPAVCPCEGQRFTVRELLANGTNGKHLFSCLYFKEILGGWDNQNFRKQRPNEAKARASWSKMLTKPQPVTEDA